MGIRNAIARWVNSALAGRRVIYWVDDNIETTLTNHMPNRTADTAAALVLVNGFRKADMQEATYRIGGITLKITRDEAAP